jgi:hypothetical protein
MDEIKRLNYFDGQFLVASDFQAEQNYHRQLRYHHNRTLHSPGIVDGLVVTKVSNNNQQITVSSGHAIDAQGREMVLTTSQALQLSSFGPNAVVFITLQFNDTERDEADRRPGDFARISERARLIPTDKEPLKDNSVMILARVQLDSQSNVGTIDASVRSQRAGSVIAPQSIQTDRLADKAVTSTKIALSAVGTEQISDGAVTTPKILPGAVRTDQIGDAAVATVKIADNAITTTKVAPASIGTNQIIDGAVTAAKVAPKAITNIQLADSAITANKLSEGAFVVRSPLMNKLIDLKRDTRFLVKTTVQSKGVVIVTGTGIIKDIKVLNNAGFISYDLFTGDEKITIDTPNIDVPGISVLPISITKAFPVTVAATTHTFAWEIVPSGNVSSAKLVNGSLVAVFIPCSNIIAD